MSKLKLLTYDQFKHLKAQDRAIARWAASDPQQFILAQVTVNGKPEHVVGRKTNGKQELFVGVTIKKIISKGEFAAAQAGQYSPAGMSELYEDPDYPLSNLSE